VKVARLHGPGDVRVQEEPAPVARPGEELVRVTAVGICGSDLHWYERSGIGDASLDRPLVLGHEAAGVIAGGPRAGQRVALDPQLPCGACEACAAGRGHLCPEVRFLGHSVTDGAMRELIAWPAANLVPLPDGIDDAAGAMLEPLGVALHALGLARTKPGGTVAVLGCGPIGLLAIQVALAAGAAMVVATDRLPHRVAAARGLGAVAVPVEDETDRAAVMDLTRGRGADAVVEAAGDQDAVATAVAVAAPGASVVIAGIPPVDHLLVDASTARRRGLDLRFARRMVRTYPRAIELVRSGRVDPISVVTDRFGLDDVGRAFASAARREGLKVLVEPRA
jgi:L-iditol 2-dehydrogenase